jgi:cell division protein FtsL
MISAVRRQPIAPKAMAVTRRYLRQALTLLGVGIIIALVFVWARVQVIELGYEVSRIRKETTDLVQQRDLLESEVASLKAPERLARIAAERFGMRLPMGDEVVIVGEGPAQDDWQSDALPPEEGGDAEISNGGSER